jgi:L-ascorbate metabolism protein UlaG (beta-lactamase superfamily)
MDWWQEGSVANGDLTITATPARHFSGRGLLDRNATLWASWVMVGPQHRVFFSGDTGPFAGFAEIGAAFGPFDLTLIENGAYDRTWPDIHLSPEQVVDAHRALGGAVLLPIHWGTFDLAIHDWFEPPERLLRAAREQGIRLALPRPGEPVEPDRLGSPSTWWSPGMQRAPTNAGLASSLALESGELGER